MSKSSLLINIIFLLNLLSGVCSAGTNLENLNIKVVEEILPNNSVLIEPKDPRQTKSVQEYDFDKNGKNELLVTYKEIGEENKIKAMILKEINNKWEKIWDTTGEGYDIDISTLEDINGDGIKEYVIGWMIGASAGSRLEIYQWKNGTLQKTFNYSFYHEIEFLKDGKQTSLAIWDRFCCDAYTVEVVGWNGKKIDRNDELFAKYYPKIEEFYKNKIKTMDAWFYWYALADAQIKANLLEDARYSITKGFSFNLANKEFTELQKILEEKMR